MEHASQREASEGAKGEDMSQREHSLLTEHASDGDATEGAKSEAMTDSKLRLYAVRNDRGEWLGYYDPTSTREECEWCVKSIGGTVVEFVPARELTKAYRSGFDAGRAKGRAEVGKYSDAIGRIEAAIGYSVARPLSDTVAAVESLAVEFDKVVESRNQYALELHLLRDDFSKCITEACECTTNELAQAKARIAELEKQQG